VKANSYTFSGHETFHCRQFWLKKGVDLLFNNKKFSENAVADLGVGRNMVSAVRHWMVAFDLFDGEALKRLPLSIFNDDGWDPYLEDEGTLWLLHYLIANNKTRATTYYLIFNNLKEDRPEFNETQFIKYVNSLGDFNQNTLKKDFSVFLRTYLGKKNERDLEDSFSGVLSELGLIEEQLRSYHDEEGKLNKQVNYLIQRKERPEIPAELILYAILQDQEVGKSVNFEQLYKHEGSVGTIFALNRDGLLDKLEAVAAEYSNIVLKSEAGIRELQFTGEKPDPLTVLNAYYEHS
jgi:hypothetical protein